ncbi:MAG: glutamate-5-semialdehyde dehydrogenase, partial [Burkholderiales bacterium]
AAAIRANEARILEANADDMVEAKAKGLSAALLDRLMLDSKRVAAMAKGLEEIAALPDPVGRTLAEWDRPNGLEIARVAVPLGVIGIIYESRPNVTADAGGLCLKSGNAAILRGGSESARSSTAIIEALQIGLRKAGLPAEAIQAVPTSDRAAVGILLGMHDLIDIIVPRGGKGLIERVAAESRIPVIMHLEGNNHTYIDGDADPEKARKILINAKMRRTGVCGATETVLVDTRAKALIPVLIDDLIRAGCEVRGDVAFQAADNRVKPATDADWDTEYLDAIIAAKVVDGVVWGRGALDMKSGVAMMVTAFLRAKAEGQVPPGGLVLAVLSDEEAGGDFGAKFLAREHPDALAGVRHALGEVGGVSVYIAGRRFYPIQVAEKRMCHLKATVRGPGGHAARPFSG